MMQREKEGDSKHKKERTIDSTRKNNISIMGITKKEEREKGKDSLFKRIVDENCPNP